MQHGQTEYRIPVLGVTSDRSVQGINTFKEFLADNFCFQVFRKSELDWVHISNNRYRFLFLHNTIGVPDALLRFSVVYCLQSLVERLEKDSSARKRLIENRPLAIWCNTRTACERLANIGIPATCRYRPSPRFQLPQSFPGFAQEKNVLWYYKAEHPWMTGYVPKIKELIAQIRPDIQVYTFPDIVPPIAKENVRGVGRIDMRAFLPHMRGMVRVSDPMDYGRSTFDVLSHGRWVAYVGMDEDMINCVETFDSLPEKIEELIDNDSEDVCYWRYLDARKLDPGKLADKWRVDLLQILPGEKDLGKALVEINRETAPSRPKKEEKADIVYDQKFFQNQSGGSITSAKVVVPILNDLFHPKSVCDIGGGIGSWLAVWRELGVEDVICMDGDWVDQNQLLIPEKNFLATDLSRYSSEFVRKFDLAMCLEVAEHLPIESSATLIARLVDISDTVLFSAAIPGQRGRNHINEQWQSYWVRLFNDFGYGCLDSVRPLIWNDKRVKHWYRQNIFIAQRGVENDKTPDLFDIVHPEQLERCVKRNSSNGIMGVAEKGGTVRSPANKKSLFDALKRNYFGR